MLCILFVSLKEHKLPEGRDCPLFYSCWILSIQFLEHSPRSRVIWCMRLHSWVLERAHTSTTKTDNRILTWAKDLNRRFLREDTRDQWEVHEKLLIVTSHEKYTQMRYHFASIRVAVILEKQNLTSVGKNVEKLEPLRTAGGNVKRYSCCGRQYGGSWKYWTESPYHSAIPLWVYIQEN